MEELRTDVTNFRVHPQYIQGIYQEDAELIFEFFMVYSRFEFALKQSGYLRQDRDYVSPDWKTFSITIEDMFDPHKSAELLEAYRYYLSQPPKRQVIKDNRLSLKDNIKGKNETDFCWVIRSIGIARNNLFHGGKFPWDQIRDVSLLSSGLFILYECVALDKRVENFFHFVPERYKINELFRRRID